MAVPHRWHRILSSGVDIILRQYNTKDADAGKTVSMVTQKVTGVILAAGRSSRMGRPKALLPAGGSDTFVSALVRTMTAGGTADVLVVTRPGDVALDREIVRVAAEAASHVRRIENSSALDGGQLSSIVTALAAVGDDVRAVLIVPVDMPLIRPSTVRRLIDLFGSTQAAVLRAVRGGRHGHPVLFSRAVFDELRCADPAVGARSVVRAHGAVDVEVEDPGVLEDVDTAEDYERLFRRPPPE
jgi:molybdenum cofactor cytidylyltransferase